MDHSLIKRQRIGCFRLSDRGDGAKRYEQKKARGWVGSLLLRAGSTIPTPGTSWLRNYGLCLPFVRKDRLRLKPSLPSGQTEALGITIVPLLRSLLTIVQLRSKAQEELFSRWARLFFYVVDKHQPPSHPANPLISCAPFHVW